jgi:hypothetical protein
MHQLTQYTMAIQWTWLQFSGTPALQASHVLDNCCGCFLAAEIRSSNSALLLHKRNGLRLLDQLCSGTAAAASSHKQHVPPLQTSHTWCMSI